MGMVVPLSGSCTTVAPLPGQLSGTFLQVWPAEIKRTEQAWHEKLYLTRLLGCSEITIQWLNYGPDPGAYQIPDAMLGPLLDYAAANTLSVRLGLPYDYRYWEVLAGRTSFTIDEFLTAAARDCQSFIAQSKWSHHRAFAGWYLPYEIEQYSWRYSSDAGRLVGFLHQVADLVAGETLVPLAVSTFSSKLADGDTLAVLWDRILDAVRIRPMVQDGVGSGGLDAYRALRPVLATLTRRNASFDVVIELFTDRGQIDRDGSSFDAVAADYDRVCEQIALASESGAERLLGFAVDPYMLGERPGAPALLDNYRAGLNARSQQPPDFAMLRAT